MAGLQNQCLANLATTPNKNQIIALLNCLFSLRINFGRSGETRTHDPLLVKQPLLPLSYASKLVSRFGFCLSGHPSQETAKLETRNSKLCWSCQWELNPQPAAYKAAALIR